MNNNIIVLLLDSRFNGSFITRFFVSSIPVCVLHCLNNECCRSVNYRKTRDIVEAKDNCELLSVLDHPQFLIGNRDYSYSILTQPIRVSNRIVIANTCHITYFYGNNRYHKSLCKECFISFYTCSAQEL